MTNALEVKNLRKSYGNREALKGIDLSVGCGETFALLGANGAGKTTTLECIEGLRKFDSGTIRMNGRAGIQLQSASLPPHLRGQEAVQLFSAWNGTYPDDSMLESLGMREIGRRQYREMSTGQKRRLHLALALLSDPDIVFLDEPTAGLDVEGRAALHEYIRLLQKRGRTIILATHDMSEVEELCTSLAILRDGTIAFAGTVAELKETFGTRYNVCVRTATGEDTFEIDDTGRQLMDVLENYSRRHEAIRELKVDRGSLEQHFVRIAGKENAV